MVAFKTLHELLARSFSSISGSVSFLCAFCFRSNFLTQPWASQPCSYFRACKQAFPVWETHSPWSNIVDFLIFCTSLFKCHFFSQRVLPKALLETSSFFPWQHSWFALPCCISWPIFLYSTHHLLNYHIICLISGSLVCCLSLSTTIWDPVISGLFIDYHQS